MASAKEKETQTPEVLPKEPLTINLVLDSVYEQLVAGVDSARIIRQFENEWCEWGRFHDINGSRTVNFELSGVLFETGKNKGILVVKSDERETSWYSSLIKVVAWTRLKVGRDERFKTRVEDYPSWDDVPLQRMLFELPKRPSELLFRTGGLLENRGQRLVVNNVIPMQPEFVAQREMVDQNIVRGPGGVFVERPRGAGTDRMYAEDIVASGTLYKPEIVSHVVKGIKRDFSRKQSHR